jgi:predicted DNA-binding transcriptional regulator YafY
VSRTARLLELMIRVRDRPRFTVDEMAREFEVSRRTMLRDLQALSAMGVPLSSVPGPGGGYSLIASARMPPLSLSVDEAVSIVLSYESFLQYADSPFAEQSISAITKLRNAMPADVVRQLDELRAHIAVLGQERVYRAPFLGQLLAASIEHTHLRIGYESRARTAERLVFPIGLYASEGFWYLACHDHERGEVLGLRADRVRSVERVEGLKPPTDLTLRAYLAGYRSSARDLVRLRARVGRPAAFSFDYNSLFGGAANGEDSGMLDTLIPRADIGWFADHILPLGPEFVVEEPAELIAEIRRRAGDIAALYGG